MSLNYDNTTVGKPYVRNLQLVIDWPDAGKSAKASLIQTTAVPLLDGTVRVLDRMEQIDFALDAVLDGTTQVPTVNMNTCLPTGQNVTLNSVLRDLFAILHDRRVKAAVAAGL